MGQDEFALGIRLTTPRPAYSSRLRNMPLNNSVSSQKTLQPSELHTVKNGLVLPRMIRSILSAELNAARYLQIFA